LRPGGTVSTGAANAAANSAAVANRSTACFASARSTARFTGSGSPARFTRGGSDDGGEHGPEDREGDRPVVLEVVGEVGHGHPARAQLALDAVAVGEGRRQAAEGSGTGDDRNRAVKPARASPRFACAAR
jgi:hypothetical protein